MGGQHKTQLPINCKACGVEFWTRAYYVTSGKRKFCSLKCSSGGEFNPSFKGSTKTDYERKKESVARHPEKHRCRHRFEYAKKRGKVHPRPCFVCAVLKVEGHHWDYSRPLDVFWLCRACHIAVHKGRITLPLPSVPVIPAV